MTHEPLTTDRLRFLTVNLTNDLEFHVFTLAALVNRSKALTRLEATFDILPVVLNKMLFNSLFKVESRIRLYVDTLSTKNVIWKLHSAGLVHAERRTLHGTSGHFVITLLK